MLSERASALGLLLVGFLAAAAAAGPDVRAQIRRRQNDRDCLDDLDDILDDAPTVLMWPATACDYTSTLGGTDLTSRFASYRSRMASWYSQELDDITSIERSCTQFVSVFDQIRKCYVTGPFPTPGGAASTPAATASATGSAAPPPADTASSGGGTSTSTGAATGTSTPSGTPSPGPDNGGGLDAGAKAGLAIGIVLAVLLIMFISYKFLQRYRSKRMAGAVGKGAVEPHVDVAGVANAKRWPPENSVYAYKSELSGDPRPVSELDSATAVARPGVRPRDNAVELDPEPPTQLSELPADERGPAAAATTTTTATRSPPPEYVSAMANAAHRSTPDTAVSPISPDSNTMQSHGFGVATGHESLHGAGSNTAAAGSASGGQAETVQYGWGRGWLRKGQE